MDKTQELNLELQMLNRIITESIKHTDIRTILGIALDEAINICGLEGGTVCTITAENTLHLTVERNTSEATKQDLLNNKIKIEECLCGECALEQKPLILHNREEVLAFSSREAQRGEDIRFHAAFPIVVKGKSMGVLCVFTYTDKKPSERNLKLVETLTSQMSLVLENAHLHQYLQNKIVALEKEIKEHKKAEENIAKLNRLYHFISQINQMIVRITDEQTLFREACKIAVDFGKFRMAWIGLLEEKTNKIIPVMHAGEEKGYLSKIKIISVATEPEGKGPTGTALREGRHIVCNDIANDPRMVPWKIEAIKRDYRSSIALPIKKFGKTIGAFSLYASEINFFDQKEITLLEEVTGDISFALDIFEKEKIKQQSLEALFKSEQLLSETQRLSKIGGWEYDVLTNQTYFSEEICKIYGLDKEYLFPPEEGIKFYHPDDRSKVFESFTKAINSGEPYDHEVRFINASGENLWVKTIGRAVFENGKVVRVIGNLMDITERKQSEDALKKSEVKFRSVFEHSVDAIGISKTGIHAFVNTAYLKLFGYSSREELAGKPILDLIAPEERDKILQFVTLRSKGGPLPDTYETKGLRKDGSEFNMDVHVSGYELNGEKFTQVVLRDITERKKAETALQASNFSLSEAQRISKIGNWTYFMNGELKWSDNLYQLYGLPSKITSTTPEYFFELVHPDDREKMQKWMMTILAGETPGEYEFRSILPDGSIHYYGGSGEFQYDKENNPVYLRGTVQDITERKKAQEKIAKSEELFSGAFHTSPAGIIITRISDGKIIDANESFLKMFEFSREETIGHTSVELNMLAPGERVKLIQKQIESGGLINFELLSQSKSGKPVNILFSSKQLVINEEQCHITTIIDITERKKAETELRGERDRFEKIVNTVPGVICTFKLNPDGSSSFPYSSHALVDMFGINPQDLKENSSPLFQKIHPDDIEKIQKAVIASSQNMSEYLIEYRFEHPQKGWIWIEAHSLPAANPDGSIVWTGFVSDTTERKKAEHQILLKNEELRDLSTHLQNIREEERKNIAREVHDELGQQLAALKIDTKWLSKRLAGDEKTKIRTSEMLQLIDETIKTIRKISSELRPEILDELGLVAALEWKVKKICSGSGIKCNLQIDCGELVFPSGVPINIFRIFQESLINIAKHAEATEINLWMKKENKNLRITLTDKGKGFDPEKTKQKKSFGLLGMKERAKMIGGEIQIRSQEGKGTTVELMVPVG